MENRCGIIGVTEDEDAIELELGLSIGGSFGKAEKLKPIKKNTNHNLAEDLGEIMVFDHQTKREIQALRRQEAKKKREEKQHKRGAMVSTSVHQNGELKSKDNDVDATEERECKKNKVQYFSGNLNLKLGAEQNNPLVCPVIPVPLPCPLPYPQVQLVPFANGFAYSCVNAMPCWIGAAANEKSVVQVQPVAGTGGFRPFQAGQDSCLNQGDGNVSERNIRRDDKNRKTLSNGSPMCSSSVVSDLQSSSNQGGCSSETVTNTSYCQLEQPRINCSVASNLKGQSEQSSTSHHMDSAQSIEKSAKGIEKSASMKVIDQSTLSNPMEEGSKPETQPNLNSNPALTNETPTSILTKTIMGKPPKPQTPTHDDSFSPRNMPCVSTTGNGPNGKTINGFLYRYTKSEVSIVCVCHGSSFTPAEFVQHAGGTDVSHPLRHITVIPSSF